MQSSGRDAAGAADEALDVPEADRQPRVEPDAREISRLNRELQRVARERDAYQQEMFESNRHAAWLSHERQNLIDHINRMRSASEANFQLQLSVRDHYIANLEEMLWAKETSRYALECQIEALRDEHHDA